MKKNLVLNRNHLINDKKQNKKRRNIKPLRKVKDVNGSAMFAVYLTILLRF